MTDAGIIENGVLKVKDGLISYVGTQLDTSDTAATYIDLKGKVVSPGLVDLHTSVSMQESGRRNLYDLSVSDWMNFTGEQIQSLLSHGITTVAVRPPTDSLFGGYSSLVEIAPDSLGGPNILVDTLDYQISLVGTDDASLQFNSLQKMYRLREAIRQLRNPAYQGLDFTPLSEKEFLVKTVQKGIPLYLVLDNPVHYSLVTEMLAPHDVQYYFGGGNRSTEYIRTLSTRDLETFPPLIIGPSTLSLDTEKNRYYSIPSQLLEYGIPFAIATFAPTQPEWTLYYQAQQTVQYGIPPGEALRAVTSVSNQLVDLVHPVGVLQKGARANLLVLSGTPMDMMSKISMTIVQGRQVWARD
ncbi:MAG: hypothetical protein K9N46_07555 [Candidatus Marinimicrobia bacterium]|nr:hypothetical protein [Candidatus Neomarinimicrobiota bacterium]MCF7880579.1 hypothetical protein [Candidatus Neomarinimicrobiota bacterium]